VPRTAQQIEDDLRAQAAAEEDNQVHPGEPTLTGWLRVLLGEVIALRIAVEEHEEKLSS
jgi:hypothetical protein